MRSSKQSRPTADAGEQDPFPRLSYDEAHAMLLEAHAKGLIENAARVRRRLRLARRDLHLNQFDQAR